jgi:hypothetical protein
MCKWIILGLLIALCAAPSDGATARRIADEVIEAETCALAAVRADADASKGAFVESDRAWEPLVRLDVPVRSATWTVWARVRHGTCTIKTEESIDGAQRELPTEREAEVTIRPPGPGFGLAGTAAANSASTCC